MIVSIIIPTRNRADQLSRTLESTVSFSHDYDSYEVIVVDNGSSDDTKFVVEKYMTDFPACTIRYFYDPIPGLLTGRHRGAKESKGEILAFIDDDVHLSSTWLSTIIEVMNSQPEVMMLTGPNLPLYEIYPPKWLEYFWTPTPYGGTACGWLSLLDLGGDTMEINPSYVWGLNFIIRKSVFLEFGGFNPDNIPAEIQKFQGDGETGLAMKVAEKKLKVIYYPGVMLYHEIPASRMTYEYFDKRYFYQGVSNSFTEIRKSLFDQASEENNGTTFLHSISKRGFEFVRHRINQSNYRKYTRPAKPIPGDIKKLIERFTQKQKEGYDFHQKMYREDSSVRQWVSRNDYYLDFTLPQ